MQCAPLHVRPHVLNPGGDAHHMPAEPHADVLVPSSHPQGLQAAEATGGRGSVGSGAQFSNGVWLLKVLKGSLAHMTRTLLSRSSDHWPPAEDS